jgi:DUF4097 and DUF4098 domain-containing protein YvlB
MRLPVPLFLSTLIFLALATGLSAKEYTFQYQRVVPTGDRTNFRLTLVNGDVTVTGSDDNRLIIEAVKKVHAVSMDEAAMVADHIEIRVEQSGDRVDVATNYLRIINRSPSFWEKVLGIGGSDSYGEVNYTIQVPAGTNIEIVNTSGDYTVRNVSGNVSLQSSASNIDLNAVEGAIAIDNASGETRGELLFGSVMIRQPMGKIRLQWIEGDVRIRAKTADIFIQQERGSLDVSNAAGPIKIKTNLDSGRDYFVETVSGNIEFLVPETSSGKLEITSDMGDIKTDIPVAIESYSRQGLIGKFGLGGVKISLQSGSGNVTVAQF